MSVTGIYVGVCVCVGVYSVCKYNWHLSYDIPYNSFNYVTTESLCIPKFHCLSIPSVTHYITNHTHNSHTTHTPTTTPSHPVAYDRRLSQAHIPNLTHAHFIMSSLLLLIPLLLALHFSLCDTAPPPNIGPVSPAQHPRAALAESIRNLRMSLDRELVYFARAEEMAEQGEDISSLVAAMPHAVKQTDLRQADDMFGGFTDTFNLGTHIFRPVRPGSDVASAREYVRQLEVAEASAEADASADPPVPENTVAPDAVVTPEPVVTPIVPQEPGVGTGEDAEDPQDEQVDEDGASGDSDSVEGSVPPSPEESADVDPEETDDDDGGDDDDSVCFPADASVRLRGGELRLMKDVQLGDWIESQPNVYSRVFMFTHRMSDVKYEFLRISTANGHTITLTRSHYLYVSGRLAAAKSVRRGDTLIANGQLSNVVHIEHVSSVGLYNPQTIDGGVVVDGISATCYTMNVEVGLAHALLTPIRAAFTHLGLATCWLHQHSHSLSALVPSGKVTY